MKRMWKGLAAIVILIAALAGGVWWFAADHKKQGSETPTEEAVDSINYIVGQVIEGTLDSSYATAGSVISNADYLYVDEFQENLSEIETVPVLLVKKGDQVKAGDVLYRVGDREVKSNGNGHIVAIEQDHTRMLVSMLNYDKLYITVQLPLSMYDKINYDTLVTVGYEGEMYEGVVDRIGYENMQGFYEIRVKCHQHFILPGTTVYVTFALGEIGPSLFLAPIFLENIGGTWYVTRYRDRVSGDRYPTPAPEILEKVPVMVGEIYSRQEGDKIWEYYEILSGLNGGEYVVVEQNGN